jgi:Cytochrome c
MLTPFTRSVALRFSLAFALLAFGACSEGSSGKGQDGAGAAPQDDGREPSVAGAPAEPAAGSGGAEAVEPEPVDGTGNAPATGEPDEPSGEVPDPTGGTGPGTSEEGMGGEKGVSEPMPEPPSEAFLRGEALVEKNGCVTCHQPNFAGFTVFPNITPDEETGIGSWSDAQIVAAIRDGVDADGASLCATMMRYPFTDEEAGDVVAFLRGVPAVSNRLSSVCPGHGQ